MVGPVIFDAVKRYLVYCGFEVTLVINITDVDDKLIDESNARGMAMAALAEEMTADYMRNLDAMGVDTIDHFPRATDNIGDIIRMTAVAGAEGLCLRLRRRRVFRRRQRSGIRQAQPPQRRVACKAKGVDRRTQASARPTSPSGRAPSPASRPGTAPGARAGRAGTSNARP